MVVLGSTPASPARRGEVLTDVRLLGTRLAESTAGPGARIVPLRLADSALVDLVKIGDVVDVLAAPANESPAATRLIATDAIVVLVSAKQKIPTLDNDRVVLVALPARTANTAAGAALEVRVVLNCFGPQQIRGSLHDAHRLHSHHHVYRRPRRRHRAHQFLRRTEGQRHAAMQA